MRRKSKEGRQQAHLQNDEGWTFKPLNDQPTPQQEYNHDPPSASHQQNTEPKSQKSLEKQGNPRWVSRNRRVHGSKPRFINKTQPSSSELQPGSASNEVNSLTSEVIGLSVSEKVEKKENNGEGLASKNDSYDVESILRELSLNVEEPELEAEQLRINDQLQEDEMLAMESIYGENFFILDRQRGLRSFQIHVHIEAAEEFTVTAKLNSSTDLNTRSESSDDFVYSFKVQYLPPIVLTCLFPKSYPTHLLPYFTLSVQWLNSARISNLCSKLESIWIDQPGQEVIYRWTDWLLNFALSYLGLDKEIMLGPYGITHVGDRRAISGSVSPDIDIPSVKSYNDERRYENFLKNFHECCICFNEFVGDCC